MPIPDCPQTNTQNGIVSFSSCFSWASKITRRITQADFNNVSQQHNTVPKARFQGIWSHGTCRKISLNFIRKLGIQHSN